MIHVAKANEILDLMLGSESPATYELALSSNRPTFLMPEEDLVEPSAGDYARLIVSNSAAMFPAASNGQKSNANPILFSPAQEDWGTIRYWALIDSGVIGLSGRYATRYIAEGAAVRFNAGALVFRIR